jgi:outer membrane lipoprotein-sorting protein
MINFLKYGGIGLFVLFLHSILLSQAPLAAKEIIEKAEEQARGNSSEGEMMMSIIRPDYTRTVEMKTWSLGEDYGLTLITAPARDRGMAFLKRGNEIWNWQPSIDRVIKMPPSMMSQGWMGSDLTTDDLVRQSSTINDYNHRLLPEQSIDGVRCYVIELIPKADAAIVWGKVIAWIGKEDFLQYKTEFYDEDMELVNTISGSSPKSVGARKLLTRLEVIPADKPGNRTVLEYKEIKFDIEIEEGFFSQQNLRRIRD